MTRKPQPPRMGRPPVPLSQLVLALDGEPLAIGCVVTARATLDACGLVENQAHTVTNVCEGQLVPGRGNLRRWFYEVDNSGKPYVLLDYVRVAGPVCRPGKIV